MAWRKLNQICECLQIDAVNLEPVRREQEVLTDAEKRLLAYYSKLNSNGRGKVEEYLKDISMIPAYGKGKR